MYVLPPRVWCGVHEYQSWTRHDLIMCVVLCNDSQDLFTFCSTLIRKNWTSLYRDEPQLRFNFVFKYSEKYLIYFLRITRYIKITCDHKDKVHTVLSEPNSLNLSLSSLVWYKPVCISLFLLSIYVSICVLSIYRRI